ncbi:MAG: hypothetical protein FWF18_01145 [Dehalococcoidia bacterium]|nr:hypothetical protein [Dehalococcoidia bacterium]
MSFAQVHPGGEVPITTPASSGCFVTRRLASPAWIYEHSGLRGNPAMTRERECHSGLHGWTPESAR